MLGALSGLRASLSLSRSAGLQVRMHAAVARLQTALIQHHPDPRSGAALPCGCAQAPRTSSQHSRCSPQDPRDRKGLHLESHSRAASGAIRTQPRVDYASIHQSIHMGPHCSDASRIWSHTAVMRSEAGGRACLQQDVEVGRGLSRDGKAGVLLGHAGPHQGLGGPCQAGSRAHLLLRVLHQGCVGCQQLSGMLRASCKYTAMSAVEHLGAAIKYTPREVWLTMKLCRPLFTRLPSLADALRA